MAVYTKINQTEIQIIENKFNIGKIFIFSEIKKVIEVAITLQAKDFNKISLFFDGCLFRNHIQNLSWI